MRYNTMFSFLHFMYDYIINMYTEDMGRCQIFKIITTDYNISQIHLLLNISLYERLL